MEPDEKTILRFITKNRQAVSVNEIKSKLKMTEYKVRKSLQVLEERKLVKKTGNGPSTKYMVEIESVEFLTQMQMAMDALKKQVV